MASGLLFRRWAQRPTFYYEVSGLAGVCGIYYIYNLETVPVSGRRRFNCISDEWEEWLGLQQLESLLQEYQGRILPEMSREHQMAVRVMERLVPFSGLADKDWEVRVIQDDEQKNAFVLPGGKVFIFTGILQYCKDEDGLAAVLGHEIAHNVAHHAAERTSQFMVLAPIGAIVVLAGGVDYSVWRLVTNLAFTLPGSRQQEEEADYIGLLMMAQGCYNPQAALRLWASMEQAEKGREPPQMLSTHPSHHSRLERIQSWLGEANDKREMSDCAATAWHMDRFRQTADFQRW